MDNGVYQTLSQVMEFYNNGGAAGLGINLSNQTLSKENLHLTEKEKEDIIGFMESLEKVMMCIRLSGSKSRHLHRSKKA